MSFARAAISVSIEQLSQQLEAKMMMAPGEIEGPINLPKGVAS
jgi:hypothetical protein